MNIYSGSVNMHIRLFVHLQMNLSEYDQMSRLEETQAVILQQLLPAIVTLVIFCFIGIIGNIATIIFYAQKSRRSSTFLMITSLAAIDLAVCVAMILSIWEMAVLVTAYYSVVCKLTHFFGRWSVGCSCFVLWMITIDRYRKICKPFNKQITVLKAKQFVAGFVILAFMLSVKELIHYSSIKIPLNASNSNETINGYYCKELDGSAYKISISVFNAIDMLLFAVIWVSQIIVYILIIYNLVKIRNKKEKVIGLASSKQANVNHGDDQDDSSFTGGQGYNLPKTKENISDDKTSGIDLDDCLQGTRQCTSICLDTPEPISNQASTLHTEHSRPFSTEIVEISTEKPPEYKDNCSAGTLPKSSKGQGGQGHMKHIHLSKIEIKLTLMLFTVSLVFILCFTPYFILVMWALSSGKEFELEPGIKFAIRLPFLNSVFNPIVYFAFNAEFRAFVRRLTHRKCLLCRENA